MEHKNSMILVCGFGEDLPSFYLCNHETTEKEFYEIMNGDYPDEAPSNKPIVNVSVFDALIYCNLRSRKENLQPYYNINGTKVTVNKTSTGYRLPTADEWIFACKDLIDFQNINEYAWFHERYVKKEIHEVCQKKANELGLYDMFGNVWEWSFDPKNNSFEDLGGCFKNDAKDIKYQIFGSHKILGIHTKCDRISFRVARNIPVQQEQKYQTKVIVVKKNKGKTNLFTY